MQSASPRTHSSDQLARHLRGPRLRYINGFPVIEGLLNAVHLDHLIELEVSEDELLKHTGERIELTGWQTTTSNPLPAVW